MTALMKSHVLFLTDSRITFFSSSNPLFPIAGLEELRRACAGFVQCCINVDTVCALLASAERYIQYKCTKSLVQKVLEFVDEHGNEVLNLGSFTLLPQHVVRLILAREELRADEFTKFQAALM